MIDTKNILNDGVDPDRIDPLLQALSTRWRGIDLRQLSYFAVLARERHFGRAAARLRISQPPLSMQIKALEARLGAQLLVRGRHGAVLTPAGQTLYESVVRMLPLFVAGLEASLAVARGERGRLRIGFVTPAGASFLPGFVRRLRERWPDIEIVLHEGTSDEQFVALEDGRIDAGFVLAPVPESFALYPVHEEALVLALPATLADALVGPEPLAAASLPEAPLLVFPRDKAPALHDEILAFYLRAGRVPRIGQQAIQMQTIINLVAAGLGVAMVPASMRHTGGAEVVFRDLAGAAPRIRIGVAWRRAATSEPLRRFLQALGVDESTIAA